MKLINEEIQRLRDIRIYTILGKADMGRRLQIRCPLPNHRDSTPSFTIYPNNSWCCYGSCNKTGQGAIDFCVALGFSFPEACEELKRYL